MKRIYPYLLVCAMVWLMGCASTGGDSADRRVEWAKPCQISGVANCDMIEPGLYRSAQPTRQGIENLKKMGVVVKRAKYFLLCCGRYYGNRLFDPETIRNSLLQMESGLQLSMFDNDWKRIEEGERQEKLAAAGVI